MNEIIDKQNLQNFFLNSNIEINFGNFFIALLLSLLLSLIVKITYLKVGRALNDKDYFSDTFIPLAIITTLVITVVKFSLALSLGLVGALSIVRFRAAIKEPEELVYIFFVISIGLANGANQFALSTVATLLIISFLLIRNIFQSKKENEFKKNESTLASSFINGLITNLFNIKAFIFFVSLFTVLIDSINGIFFYIYPRICFYFTFQRTPRSSSSSWKSGFYVFS